MKKIIFFAICLYLTDAHFRANADRKIASVSTIAKKNKPFIKKYFEKVEQTIEWVQSKLN